MPESFQGKELYSGEDFHLKMSSGNSDVSNSQKISFEVLSRYLPATIVSFLSDSSPIPPVPPFRQNLEAVIMFADISGFTSMSEKLSVENLAKYVRFKHFLVFSDHA